MEYIIRTAELRDYDEIYELIKTAFFTAYLSDGTEQDFAVALRNSKNYIKELELVMEVDSKIVGHVMMTELGTNGKDLVSILLLAPICIAEEYRNNGLGEQLIDEGLKRATELDYNGVFLLGDPKFYNRVGFIRASELKVYDKVNKLPDEYFLGIELKPNSFEDTEFLIDVMESTK
ncbi:MAG: N-acetyltransferase [Tissierellia bacterium]|nr:N-acetyltransferase [Tissierellia bacterium]